jgi:hypothetical protein
LGWVQKVGRKTILRDLREWFNIDLFDNNND